jgi:hypothetical protein
MLLQRNAVVAHSFRNKSMKKTNTVRLVHDVKEDLIY